MNYLKRYKWSLVPNELPKIKRRCPKCNKKTTYRNCRKFRINANKNDIDVWNIYKCEKCKSTWNMSIYERVNPKNIKEKEYDELLDNDNSLIWRYAFHENIYQKNKVEVDFEDVDYRVIKEDIGKREFKRDETVIYIESKYLCKLKICRVLSENLKISKSKMKNMYKEGKIFAEGYENILKAKVNHNIRIHIVGEI